MYNDLFSPFIGTSKAEDLKFFSHLLGIAKEKSFTRVVEPCCGLLPVCNIALSKGFQDIEASDISLIPTVVGRYISGQSIEELECKSEYGFDVSSAAKILYYSVLSRIMKSASATAFYDFQIRTYMAGAANKIQNIQDRLDTLREAFRGKLSFTGCDMMEHLDAVADDERAIVLLFTPLIKGGYERFYDVGISWNAPKYKIFDPDSGVKSLLARYKDAKALIVFSEIKKDIRELASPAFYVRAQFSKNLDIYLEANSERIKDLFNENVVIRKPSVNYRRIKNQVIPYNYKIREDSKADVIKVPKETAFYYCHLFSHKYFPDGNGTWFLSLIDGFITGVFSMMEIFDLPYVMSTFAPYHERYRLIRLNIYLSCMRRYILMSSISYINKYSAEFIYTTVFSRHPSSMFYRSIMKIEKREKVKDGWKITYKRRFDVRGLKEVWLEFYKNEIRYEREKERWIK